MKWARSWVGVVSPWGYGLNNVMSDELIEFPVVYGMAQNLEEDSVGCVIR